MRRPQQNGFFFRLAALFCAIVILGEWKITAAPPPSASQTALFSSRLWQMDAGLPNNSVTTLVQTRDGFLRVGTLNGLVRFDGVKFVPLDLKEATGQSQLHIFALCEGGDGSLWVGTEKNGALRLKDGKLIHYGKDDGLSSDSIRALLSARDGSIWIGTTNGLSRFKDNQFAHYTETNGLSGHSVRCLLEDHERTIWVVSGFGSRQLQQFKNGTFHDFHIAGPTLPNNAVRSLWVDRQSNVWLGVSSGLVKHDSKGKNTFFSKSVGLVDDVVSALYEDRSGNFWIGTYGGLSRGVNNSISREFNRMGAYFDRINTIAEDTEGNVWLGTRFGLCRVSPAAFTVQSREHGLTHNNIMSLCEGRHGEIWAGAWGGGLNWLRTDRVHSFTQQSHFKVGLKSDFILGLNRQPNGQLWIGTDYNGGIFRATIGADGWPTFEAFGGKEGFTNRIIRVIHTDSQTNVWFGTQEALVILENKKFTSYTAKEGLAGLPVRDILEDRDGSHWIGTDGGLSHFKDGQFKNFTTNDGLSDNAIRALFQDARTGTLWIGTAHGGVGRMKNEKVFADGHQIQNAEQPPAKENFTFYGSADGLFSDEVFEIVDDLQGSFWMSCVKGIFRIRKTEFDEFDAGKIKTLRCTPYGYGDGSLGIQCNGVAKPGAIRSNGRILFATIKGVVLVDPNFTRSNSIVPPVFIEEVVADKRTVSTVQRFNDLTIPPGPGDLEFHFTALSFQEPERVRFKYKLEGVDDDWMEAGNRRDARYNNVPPGDYTFHVTACNNDGLWNSLGANVKFTLQPHFWQTRWFYSLCALAGVMLVGGGVRFVTKRRMQHKLQLAEQQHALERERGRIAKDMHDELGANLTQISLLSELTKRNAAQPDKVALHADRISETAHELVQNMDEIVWAVNPKNDNLHELSEYIFQYAESFLSLTPIRYRMEKPSQLPSHPLRAEVRHNAFLVVKEALNNTVKHANATEVWLRLSVPDSLLEISVEDNGKGLAEKPLSSRNGNGLSNMRKRIEDIGGQFELESKPGAGTKIRLSVKLNES